MSFKELIDQLNPMAQAIVLAVACGLILLLALAEWLAGEKKWWKRVRVAVMPLVIAGGYVTAYAMMNEFPKGTDDRPWYLVAEVWKMLVIAAIAAGVLLTAARFLPWWGASAVVAVLIGILVLMLVRGPWLAREDISPWPNWKPLAWMLAGSIAAYLLALAPAWREEKLWLIGTVIPWIACAAAVQIFMDAFDQKVGKLEVATAILAGMSAAVGAVPRMRALATGAGPMLAVLFAMQLMMQTRYDSEKIVPLASIVLLACMPLSMAVSWIPALRRKMWLCMLLAVVLAGGMGATAYGIYVKKKPPPPVPYDAEQF